MSVFLLHFETSKTLELSTNAQDTWLQASNLLLQLFMMPRCVLVNCTTCPWAILRKVIHVEQGKVRVVGGCECERETFGIESCMGV